MDKKFKSLINKGFAQGASGPCIDCFSFMVYIVNTRKRARCVVKFQGVK